ncbi:hypothetical protein NM208_g13097 [Fusarium decemcellulare]|uniref:Uncharacterized protein n=1 Tax=Fusarium decemcellulare TaxID=57161 RepID=A0ACC1RQG4_9HYPO|nr:hypothetical protein NM208_g13097 [Fusarium decemcellulare]
MDPSEIDDESLKAIVQVQLDDLEECDEVAKKRKDREWDTTDQGLAIEAYRDELNTLKRIATDRAFAVTIDQGTNTDENQATTPEPTSTVQAAAETDEPTVEATPQQAKSIFLSALVRMLTAPDVSSFLSRARSGILHCFRPVAASNHIPVDNGNPHFSTDLLARFQAKKLEYDTPNPTYCSVSSCSAFIPPQLIENDIASCPLCHQKTCVHCETQSHTGVCPKDAASQELLQLAQDEGWQRCKACGAIVELNQGCNHISCRCGAHFCYQCGETWKTCDCAQWDEAEIWDRANAVAARAPGALLIQPQLIQRIMQNLRVNHECDHDSWRRRRGIYVCENCTELMPHFIYECGQCALMACASCRWNRL